MNINNSKQIPFMRWRDFKNFEKFTFIHGAFGFDVSDETYENASKDTNFKLIIEKMLINSKSGDVTPLILYDYDIGNVYIGYIDEIEHAQVASISSGAIDFADLQYNSQNDTLNIQHGSDDVLSTDNVKTIFNQKITGTGNITLFRHKLTISDMSSTGVRGVILDYLSTSNLNVDSLQDLQTLLDVSRNDRSDTTFLGYLGVKNYTITYKYLSGLFVLSDGTTEYNVTSVSDKVKPL